MRFLLRDRRSRATFRRPSRPALALALAAVPAGAFAAADTARGLLDSGRYEEAIVLARDERTAQPYEEESWSVEIEALTTTGRHLEAHETVLEGLKRLRGSLRLRLAGLDTAPFAGDAAGAENLRAELHGLVTSRTRYVRDLDSLVAVGEAALRFGVEPRLVLENFFKRGMEAAAPVRSAFLAAGRLALAKGDHALASTTFQKGIAVFPGDPAMWTGLAESFLEGDRARLAEYAAHALRLNPRHPPAHLLLAEQRIDAEDYTGARLALDQVLGVDPAHPGALALLAVLAHLDNDPAEARRLREEALVPWPANPAVDHRIGRKLSHKYRFAEGADFQRDALALDEAFAPARLQLAQDLLRLGREDEAWPLVADAHEADAYNVTAYNLVTLKDRLAGFTVLENEHFRLRMSLREAPIYGPRALALLEEARRDLTETYGLELAEKITVEIYPDPKDFAVRTFGMPDNPGFLGVCFGPVVTINSPATRRANWEAVLWHEFAHVITLTLTRNRMPRWLSEGISVYEETRRDPSWGQRMTLDHRERILAGRARTITGMSAAFLQATDGADLRFAYFQSYLAVRFLIETHGFPALRALLLRLGEGVPATEALAATIGPPGELDLAFRLFAEREARAFGGGLDFSRPAGVVARALAPLGPRSFHDRLEAARAAVEAGDWAAARGLLEPLAGDDLYLPGADNPLPLLARVYRETGDAAAEVAVLTRIATREADALEAVTRLLELAEVRGDDAEVLRWTDRWLAINPLAAAPWRARFAAHERRGEAALAADSGSILLKLDPPDRPSIHHRIARQLRDHDVEAARRNVLLALAEAPRFQAAHELLAELPVSAGLAGPASP